MESLQAAIRRPSRQEQHAARESYGMFRVIMKQLTAAYTEIRVGESAQPIKVPAAAMELLTRIMQAMSKGRPITLVPVATELTTQAAAELLGCSRPHLVKLLETGEIPFTKVGRHRRVKYEDMMRYKDHQHRLREQLL